MTSKPLQVWDPITELHCVAEAKIKTNFHRRQTQTDIITHYVLTLLTQKSCIQECAKLSSAISVGPQLFCNYFKDGKITKKEWLMMWKTYKKEISEKEKEQKDFLRNYYRHSLRIHLGNCTDGEKKENLSAEVIYDSN